MKIELLKDKDILQASKLARKIINQTFYYSKQARKEWSQDYSPKMIKDKLKSGIWFFFVAKDKNKIVGFSDVRIEGKVGRSEWSCVDKNYRRRGVGKALFKRKIQLCKNRSCHKIVADSRMNNREGIAFLKSLGFRIEARMRNHWFKQDYYYWGKYI